MLRFYCSTCRKEFEAEGRKDEYVSPVYGPCSHYIADCPDCGKECGEYRVPKNIKLVTAPEAPSCGAGGCCCGM
ncbi:MAG: hypothetical protein ACPLXM_00115 [Bacteroidales bacterium]